MRITKVITSVLFVTVFISGCLNPGVSSDNTASTYDNIAAINDKTFTIREINDGIKSVFNSYLFYSEPYAAGIHAAAIKGAVLGNEVKYDMYFESTLRTGLSAFVSTPKIYIVTDIQHPLNENEVYVFGIDLTEQGLRSEFSYIGSTVPTDTFIINEKKPIFMGGHIMLFESIERPVCEVMDSEWEKNVVGAVKLFAKKNNFYSRSADDPSPDPNFPLPGNLPPGNYTVYIKSFFASDADTVIVFENENGSFYRGALYFVHSVAENKPADINELTLIPESCKKQFRLYLDRIRENPAAIMQCSVSDNR